MSLVIVNADTDGSRYRNCVNVLFVNVSVVALPTSVSELVTTELLTVAVTDVTCCC